MAGSFTVGGAALGLLTGEKIYGPLSMIGNAPIDDTAQIVLASGDNTIAVPTGAIAVWIVLPVTGYPELKIRTNLNSGDAGLPFSGPYFGPFAFYAGTTSLIINAAGAGSVIAATFI